MSDKKRKKENIVNAPQSVPGKEDPVVPEKRFKLLFVGGIIQSLHSDTTTQIQFIKSIDNLTKVVNEATKSGGLK